MKRIKVLWTIILILFIAAVLITGINAFRYIALLQENYPYATNVAADTATKPVLYLYPSEETDVSVQLTYNGELTTTYPKYNNGWKVHTFPDGTIISNDKTYNYLYWEGKNNPSIKWDFSQGFCVKGEDTAEFLEWALEKQGLNRKEANEFIVYWLPLMERNPYNVISFQTDSYTDNVKLNVTPAPDTEIRVFMTWYSSNNQIDIEPQELNTPARSGFTLVEWGGSTLNRQVS